MTQQSHSGSGDNVAGNKSTTNYVQVSAIWVGAAILLIALGIWLFPVLFPGPVPLQGYVVSNANVPEPGVAVSLRTPDGRSFDAFTDENGKFIVEEINLRKVKEVEVKAVLKERSTDTTFSGLTYTSPDLRIQLPPGTPPFEVAYYEMDGISLNYLYDARLDQVWEARLGGQPFIIPNEVYLAFKDLGDRFYYEAWPGPAYATTPSGGMKSIEIGKGETSSRHLAGISYDPPQNGAVGTTESYPIDPEWAKTLKSTLSWHRYSPEQKGMVHIETAELMRIEQAIAEANAERDYDSAMDLYDQLSRIRAPLPKEVLDQLYERFEDNWLGLIRYVCGEQIPDRFIWCQVSEEQGCAGEAVITITFPEYHLKHVVLENTSAAPIALDSFYISREIREDLRPVGAELEEKQLAKRLFPKQTLRPGGKLLIPTQIIFAASIRLGDQVLTEGEFRYGPAWNMERVRVERQIFPFRQKNDELIALYMGDAVGSCPYAYTYSRQFGYWVLEDHILYGRNEARKEGMDEIPLHRFDGSILIRELDPETSHIDYIAIRRVAADGTMESVGADHPRLQYRDGQYVKMEQGDDIYLKFPGLTLDSNSNYYLRSFGYYLPDDGGRPALVPPIWEDPIPSR